MFVVIEEPFRVFQAGVVPVFFREDNLVGRDAPVDAEVRIIPCQCAFALGSIEVVALVLEDDFGGEHAESVGEASGDEELAVVVFGQLNRHVLAEGGGAFADVYRHIEHGTLDHPYQLALRIRRFLEVQAAQHPVGGLAFVILYKLDFTHLGVEVFFGIRLEEIAPVVFEQARLDNYHAVYFSFYDVHCCPCL